MVLGMCENCNDMQCENCENDKTQKCLKSPWDSCNFCGCNATDGIVKKTLCTNKPCSDSKWKKIIAFK